MDPYKPKRIHLRMQGGFCNRLRAIVSASLWAKDLRCVLVIHWPVEPGHMPSALEELIEPASIPNLGVVREGYLKNAHQILSIKDMETVLSLYKNEDDINIESYSEFHPDLWTPRGLEILRNIRIAEHLENQAKEIWVQMGGCASWTGVHFRGTDHGNCLKASPLSSFFEKLDKKSSVFLTTDEPSVRGGFVEVLGKDSVFTCNLPIGRITTQQQKAGVIEWLLLQKCGTIVGSFGSSYSHLAALRSGAKYITPTTSVETTN